MSKVLYTYLEEAGAELVSAPACTGVLLQFLLQAGVPAHSSVLLSFPPFSQGQI